ncbi:MAG: histidine kinase [Propionicimonas sp.]
MNPARPRKAPRRSLASRALQDGVIEAFLAGAIFLLSRIERPDEALVPLSLDIVIAAGAALSGRWATAGAIVAGLGATAWLFFPAERPTLGLVAALVPLFAVVSRGRSRQGLWLTLWYLPIVLVVVTDLKAKGLTGVLFNAGFAVVLFSLVWFTGWLIHRKDSRLDAATSRYEQRLREQRLDLARDLHDTVAQTVTGMVVTTEGIRLRLDGDCPPEVQQDLDTVLRLGRQSITDLRGMMSVLRAAEPGTSSSAWRAESVARALADQSAELTRRGFRLSSRTDGDPDALPPSVRECLSKLVVEAMSNMAKHATPGGPCSVRIVVTGDAVDATFRNRCRDAGDQVDSTHLGLVGATERVAALGGSLTAERSGDQWVLHAHLPVAGDRPLG